MCRFFCYWFSGSRLLVQVLVRNSLVLNSSNSLWTTVQPAPHVTTLVALRWRFATSERQIPHHTNACVSKTTTSSRTVFSIFHTLTEVESGVQTRGKRHQAHTQFCQSQPAPFCCTRQRTYSTPRCCREFAHANEAAAQNGILECYYLLLGCCSLLYI